MVAHEREPHNLASLHLHHRALLLHAADELAADGVKAQVVSIPSIGLFLQQPAEYREMVIPAAAKKFGLTSGLPSVLSPVMNGDYTVAGLERFGASAPATVLEEKFGYTVPAVLKRIREFIVR